MLSRMLRVIWLERYFPLPQWCWCLRAEHALKIIFWDQRGTLMLRFWGPIFIPLGLQVADTNISMPVLLKQLSAWWVIALFVHNGINYAIDQAHMEINILVAVILCTVAYITWSSSIWGVAKSPVLRTFWLMFWLWLDCVCPPAVVHEMEPAVIWVKSTLVG